MLNYTYPIYLYQSSWDDFCACIIWWRRSTQTLTLRLTSPKLYMYIYVYLYICISVYISMYKCLTSAVHYGTCTIWRHRPILDSDSAQATRHRPNCICINISGVGKTIVRTSFGDNVCFSIEITHSGSPIFSTLPQGFHCTVQQCKSGHSATP